MRPAARFPFSMTLAVTILVGATASIAEAGGPFRRRPRPVVETATTTRPQDRVAPSPMLGSFMPSQYVTVRGNGVIGGGYSPLGLYGREQSLSVYGPLSAFRSTSAPVITIVRGYNGLPVVAEGTSFSNPNLPTLSPVVYPTRSNNYTALPFQATPPQWDRAIMWIDLN